MDIYREEKKNKAGGLPNPTLQRDKQRQLSESRASARQRAEEDKVQQRTRPLSSFYVTCFLRFVSEVFLLLPKGNEGVSKRTKEEEGKGKEPKNVVQSEARDRVKKPGCPKHV